MARLLSDGLRNLVVPWGPSNPAPSPSKLSSTGAAGRVPWDVCSTAMPSGLRVGGGTGGGMGSGPASWSASGSSNVAPGEVPHANPSHSPAAVSSSEATCEARGGERSCLSAVCTITTPERGLSTGLWSARDSTSGPLEKTSAAMPSPRTLEMWRLNARPIDMVWLLCLSTQQNGDCIRNWICQVAVLPCKCCAHLLALPHNGL